MKNMKNTLSFMVLIMILIGCGGGGDSSSSNQDNDYIENTDNNEDDSLLLNSTITFREIDETIEFYDISIPSNSNVIFDKNDYSSVELYDIELNPIETFKAGASSYLLAGNYTTKITFMDSKLAATNELIDVVFFTPSITNINDLMKISSGSYSSIDGSIKFYAFQVPEAGNVIFDKNYYSSVKLYDSQLNSIESFEAGKSIFLDSSIYIVKVKFNDGYSANSNTMINFVVYSPAIDNNKNLQSLTPGTYTEEDETIKFYKLEILENKNIIIETNMYSSVKVYDANLDKQIETFHVGESSYMEAGTYIVEVKYFDNLTAKTNTNIDISVYYANSNHKCNFTSIKQLKL